MSGSYQDARGSYNCKICPKGSYCDPTLLNGHGVINPLKCERGFYCPSNTSSKYQYPCPPGFYSNKDNLEKAEECTACGGGYYCTGNGNTTVSGPCNAGRIYLKLVS